MPETARGFEVKKLQKMKTLENIQTGKKGIIAFTVLFALAIVAVAFAHFAFGLDLSQFNK